MIFSVKGNNIPSGDSGVVDVCVVDVCVVEDGIVRLLISDIVPSHQVEGEDEHSSLVSQLMSDGEGQVKTIILN